MTPSAYTYQVIICQRQLRILPQVLQVVDVVRPGILAAFPAALALVMVARQDVISFPKPLPGMIELIPSARRSRCQCADPCARRYLRFRVLCVSHIIPMRTAT